MIWDTDNDGLVQEKRNSIANAMELRLSCTNSSIWGPMVMGSQWPYLTLRPRSTGNGMHGPKHQTDDDGPWGHQPAEGICPSRILIVLPV